MPDPSADEQLVQQDQLVQGAAAKSVDATTGSEAVGPDGSFSYAIPIRVPTGVRNMQPQLSVTFNSRLGNGLAGVGWTLKGIPEIHRINGGRGINFDGDDQYAVNFNGWGTPDEPGLRLVYIGTDPRPRALRLSEAASQVLLDLTNYVVGQVWGVSGYFLNALTQSAASSITTWPPVRIRGSDVPSIDVSSFAIDPTSPPPEPSPLASQVVTTWHLPEEFSWPCETTAVRCWLRVLKINPIDWPQLGLIVFGNDIFHTANETWGDYRPKGFCGDGPCYWVLRDGQGNTYYFGGDDSYHPTTSDGTGDYPIIAERFNGDRGNRGILMWSLYEVVDRYGNGYKVTYHNLGTSAPTLVPARIDYLKSGAATISKAVTFLYESRPVFAPLRAFFDTRLHGVGIEVGGQQERLYLLNYETGQSQRSRLISVQETGPDGDASTGLPPHTITWQDPATISGGQIAQTSSFNVLPFAAPIVADFNGDGYSDVAFVTQDYHGISRQFALGSSAGLGDTLLVGGDVWNPDASMPSQFTGGWAFVAGDVDGDGKADHVRVQRGPDPNAFDVGLGTASGLPQNFDTPRTVMWPGSAEDNDWGNWQILSADINNDRINDIIAVHPGAPTVVYAFGSHAGLLDPIVMSTTVAKLPHWTFIQSQSGGPPPANAMVFSRLTAGDANGDGYLDLLTSVSTLVNSNNSWNPAPLAAYVMGSEAGLRAPVGWTMPPNQFQLVQPVLADINGDGRADVVFGANEVWYGRSDPDAPFVMAPSADPATPGAGAWSGAVGDANGDGIADFIGGALGSPDGQMQTLSTGVVALSYDMPFYADLNGDGLQDVIQLQESDPGVQLWVELSTGSGALGANVNVAQLNDLGGDFADVIGSYAFSQPQLNPIKYAHAVTGDFNGDGLQDVLLFPYYMYNPGFALYGPTTTKPPYARTLPVLLSRPQRADQLSSITNPLGGTITVAFDSAARVTGAVDNTGTYERANTNPRLVVTRMTRNPGSNGPVRSLSYSYTNGRVRSGAVFEDNDLGFAEIDVLDEQTLLRQRMLYNQTYPLQRRLLESDSYDASGRLLLSDKYTYDYITPYLGVNLPRVLTKTTTRFEAGTQTSLSTTTYQHDAFGAITYVGREIDHNLVATTTSYTHDPDAWLLSRVDEKRVISRFTLHISFPPPPDFIEGWEKDIYAANGVELVERDRLLCAVAGLCTCTQNQVCVPSNPAAQARWVPVEQNKSYTTQGNLQYSADAYGHGVSFDYDPDWGGVTTTTRVATGDNGPVVLAQHKHYDGLGRLDVETDENNVSAVHHYDDFNRLRQTDLPNGSHTFIDYQSWGNPQQQTKVITTGPSAASASANLPLGEMSTQYVDGFGQIYREDTTAGEGNMITRRRLESFSAGHRAVAYNRPAFVSNNVFPPVSPANEWLVVTFDAANRPTVIMSMAGGSNTSTVETFSYAPLQTMLTDMNGNSVTTTFDSRGRVASKTDGYGTWSYQFDNVGRLVGVDNPDGSQMLLGYDNWGRRNQLSDPSLGTITLVLDDVGDTLSSTDANGTVTSTYDETGRVRTSTDSLGVILYSYDRSTADFSMGRLASVTDHAGSTSLKYDAAGHIAESARTTEGHTQPLVVDYVYDYFDRLKTKTLGATEIDFVYPDGRNLRQIVLNGQSLATLSQYDPNRLPGARQTSAATTTFGRDPRGLISDLVTVSAGGTTLQSLHANNDLLGDTHSVTDSRGTLTEGSTNTDETLYYRYDFDNRLLATIGRFPGRFTYDPEGNITLKGTTVVTYGDHTLSATSAAGSVVASDTFDAVGNLVTRGDALGTWTYTYDDDHHLMSAQLNNQPRFNAEYDYAGSRVKKVFTKPTGDTATTYYADGMELRESSSSPATSSTIYVSAARVGAIATITTGQIAGEPDLPSQLPYATSPWQGDTLAGPAAGVVFVHANTLGNPALLTDATGTVVSHALYEPFGAVIPSASVGHDVITPKFTGKENDSETGFVFFGGRYYDPVVGRFTTPDSAIPGGAGVTQGFNRYAYSLDNPIRLADPDGHDPVGGLIGAGIGGSIGLLSSLGQQTWSWAHGNGFSGRAVLATTVGGIVTGGMIGLTDGLDLPDATAAGAWAMASITGGMARRAVMNQETTPADIATDAAVGVGTLKLATVVAPAAATWLSETTDMMFNPVPMLKPAPMVDPPAPTGGNPKFASPDPYVSDVANAIETAYPGHVQAVNQPMYDAQGNLVTDGDIVLKNAVIQVKSGAAKGLANQIARTETVTDLPVIGYAPDAGKFVIQDVLTMGGLVTQDLQMLIDVVAP